MPKAKTQAKKRNGKTASVPDQPVAEARWVRLTRLALHGPEIGTETILINPANVTWVEPTAPIPIADGTVAPSTGATLHIVGQPLLPVPVLESVDAVFEAFSKSC